MEVVSKTGTHCHQSSVHCHLLGAAMSKKYVTIPANSATKPRPAIATPAQIGSAVCEFFLNFASGAVEANLTNPESTVYKDTLHFVTGAVRA
jgi:hypothetical protein